MKMMFCLQQPICQKLSSKLNGPYNDFSIFQTVSGKLTKQFNSFPICETLSHKLKRPQAGEVAG